MIRAADVLAALRQRYTSPTWAVASEVAETTGGGRRRADFVAVNCYPSQGMEVHGVEVKVSRSDWLSEIKHPAKVEEGVFRFCDRWWVATAPGIVRADELPPTWGLYELTGAVVTVVVKAPKLQAEPPSIGFLASMLRNSNKPGEEETRRLITSRVDELRNGWDAQRKVEDERHREEVSRLQADVAEFERLIDQRWRWLGAEERQDVAAYLKVALNLGRGGRRDALARVDAAVQEVQQVVSAGRAAVLAALQPGRTP